MSKRSERSMREFWNEKARVNAPWYVDTTLSFDDPDMDRFWESGVEVVNSVLEWSPKVPQGGTAIEIGCGLGRLCRALAPRFDRVIGVDISEEMVARAEELVQEENVEFAVNSGSSLAPLGDGIADLIFTFTVFQHIPDPAVVEEYIVDAGRVLKPGGVAIFQWNNLPRTWRWRAGRRLGPLLNLISRTSRGRYSAPFMGSRIPADTIRAALDGGGLEVLEMRGLGTLFAFVFAERRQLP